MYISIIVCCYNSSFRLPETIKYLANQKVSNDVKWEIIIVDNNSNDNTAEIAKKEWNKYSTLAEYRIVKETKPGLTFARKRGILESKYDVLIFCDDDNSFNEDYIMESIQFLEKYSHVGIVGGKSIPVYETTPERYFFESNGPNALGCLDLGNEILITNNQGLLKEYPTVAPIGTGMAIRKSVALQYLKRLAESNTEITDRKGDSLSGGGDNEMNIIAILNGWELAYNPRMVLNHIISANRLTIPYLCKMAEEGSISWVLLLNKYGICPWTPIASWTKELRKIKAYFFYQAWKSPTNKIKWKGACGIIEGISNINKL